MRWLEVLVAVDWPRVVRSAGLAAAFVRGLRGDDVEVVSTDSADMTARGRAMRETILGHGRDGGE